MSFKTRLYIGFVLAILLSAISGLTSYMIFQKQLTQREWMKQTRGIIDSAKNIQSYMVDMETGKRGFRATNEKRFLEPYSNSLGHIEPEISGLKKLLTNNPEEEKSAAILEIHINDLIKFWEDSSANTVSYNKAVVQLTDTEKRQMDDIRAIITQLQKDETKLLNKRREEYDTLIHNASLSSSIDSILSEIIIIILIFFIFREFNKRKKVQDQLNNTVEKLKHQAGSLQTSEEQLKKALNEVEHINKQLERFVYTVAHDIKSPLAGISGSLFILSTDETIIENPELAEFVKLSSERVVYLSEMVNSILEYSRVSLGQQQLEVVKIKELLEQIILLMLIPKHIEITVSGEMPVFKTNKIKILEVFQNLISNAIKYNDKKKGRIEIGYADKNGYYEFYVKDNGSGISKEDQKRVFTLFRTTGNNPEGESSTGFGLSIVKLIVEEQGGKIWVDSNPGNGSAFYFEWKK